MKMKFIDRLFIGLFSVVGLFLTALTGYYLYLSIIGEMEISFSLSLQLYERLIVGGIALVLFAWSLKVLLIAFKRDHNKASASVSIQNTDTGSVRISVSALDTLISQTLEHQDGIKNVKSRVINHEDSISIVIEMSLNSDINIPNITMLLQKNIKGYIEEFSGIAVREVSVLINSIVEVVPLPLQLETKPAPEYETFEMPAESIEDAVEEDTAVPEEVPAAEAESARESEDAL